jgi:glycosyltransferase involved in cell wall biosynthesis
VVIHRIDLPEAQGGAMARAANQKAFVARARDRLAGLIQPGDVVVLKTDPPLLASGCTDFALQRGARVVQWIQDIYPEIVPAHIGAWTAPLFWPLRWRRDRAWRAADLCLPVSGDMRKVVLAAGVRETNAVTMPNWAPRELDKVPAPVDVYAYRQRCGVADKFVVAYSGNLGRVHDFATMLDAAHCLRNSPTVVFFVVGDGPRRQEVQQLASERQLQNVQFLPPQPRAKLAVSLAAADVHLVTLRPGFEQLVSPSKLAGIMGAGRPALFVGPASSEISALLAREKCGASVEPGEGRRLADTILDLAGAHERRAAMGNAARNCYVRHYSFAAATARWDELLRRLAASR